MVVAFLLWNCSGANVFCTWHGYRSGCIPCVKADYRYCEIWQALCSTTPPLAKLFLRVRFYQLSAVQGRKTTLRPARKNSAGIVLKYDL